jgi:diguanylate cyclase
VLPVSYDPVLVTASILVAMMAAFMGLHLSSGLGTLAPGRRKQEIAKAAVALGGGIWSMHFIGMLAVSVPATIRYDALPTLGSVLIAILVTGFGLLVLHFGQAVRWKLPVAGSLVGLGIVAMHYVGMSAISGNCIVTYRPAGFGIATLIAIFTSIAALRLAYEKQALWAKLLGAAVLGLAISAMHYSAMAYTEFWPGGEIAAAAAPDLSTGALALLVALAAFIICGLALLTAIPAEALATAGGGGRVGAVLPLGAGDRVGRVPPAPAATSGAASRATSPQAGTSDGASPLPVRIPYERDNAIRFLPADSIAAIRAEGHYSKLFDGAAEYFCPWPISRVETSLRTPPFIRTHRSYLVNLAHVSGFKQSGDRAFCFLGDASGTPIPVSRGRVADVRRALGL